MVRTRAQIHFSIPNSLHNTTTLKHCHVGVAYSIGGSDEIYIEPNMWSSLADVDPSRPVKRQIKVKTKTAILLNSQNKIVEFGSLGYNSLSANKRPPPQKPYNIRTVHTHTHTHQILVRATRISHQQEEETLWECID